MNLPKVVTLDAAVTVLGFGMLLGLVARAIEHSHQLAGLFGF